MAGGSPAPRGPDDRVHLEFIATARRHWPQFALADTTGQQLTYGRTLVAAFAFARVLARHTTGQANVGILLPASVGAALANIALLFAGKVPVNLNFTTSPDILETSVRQAGIRTILTSKRFLDKAGIPAHPAMVFLEDLRADIGLGDKLSALWHAKFAPMRRLRRRLSGPATSASPLLTLIFSSGSTGVPKGVMISHANVLTNADSLARIFPMTPRDVFIGILPLFHSFGFTGTFWFPLLSGAAVVYHPNPTDAKTIGEIAGRYKATMLISTPTFCATYLRRCTREQFAHLRHAIVGAEKLRAPLAAEFREAFGIDLLEGYGMTEMSPVVAVNLPDEGTPAGRRIRTKPGSVGRPIPGVAVKVVDRDTGVDLPPGAEGMLLVRGGNLMMGYLDAPARTAEVLRDGWYVTGDIARVDEDGFIFITDRVSRFSKIGGEMVPHVRVEDVINAILGDAVSAVTAVEDATRGERLVAFYAKPDVTPDVLWHRLGDTDLPKLWIPKRENLIPLETLPMLGTGKVDLRRVRELALHTTKT